jgi:predicted lipid-binding transport protein (Tim44 family)
MSSTILMVIVLVVMWLVVLVPMFVRRHDESTEARSMDRFASTVRVLSRRAHAAARSATLSRPATAAEVGDVSSAAAARIRADGRRRMLARRRRTLGGLTGLLALGLLGALTLSGAFWLVTAAAAVLLGGYLGWLRQQVRRAHQRALRRAAVFSRTTPSQPAYAATKHAIRPGRTIRPSRHRAAARAEEPAEAAAPAADRSWEPTPVPAPLYVGKAIAPALAESVVALDDDDPSFAEIDAAAPAPGHRRAANE